MTRLGFMSAAFAMIACAAATTVSAQSGDEPVGARKIPVICSGAGFVVTCLRMDRLAGNPSAVVSSAAKTIPAGHYLALTQADARSFTAPTNPIEVDFKSSAARPGFVLINTEPAARTAVYIGDAPFLLVGPGERLTVTGFSDPNIDYQLVGYLTLARDLGL